MELSGVGARETRSPELQKHVVMRNNQRLSQAIGRAQAYKSPEKLSEFNYHKTTQLAMGNHSLRKRAYVDMNLTKRIARPRKQIHGNGTFPEAIRRNLDLLLLN